MARGGRRKAKRGAQATGPIEWVGGRALAPVFVHDGQEPVRPELVLWMELPSGLIVGMELVDPGTGRPSFGQVLERTLVAPSEGPARTPDRIRVAQAELAAEVRRVCPDVEVVVAPTPELQDPLDSLAAHLEQVSDTGPSYLASSHVPEDAIARMFEATARLYQMAPWKGMTDSHVVRADIPELGVSGACLSIIGALGESIGVLIFPSLAGFEAFLDVAEAHMAKGRPPEDFGTSLLALEYERATELPAAMRKEVARNGWKVAAPEAYPVVTRRDADGIVGPASERDVRIVTACASALATFYVQHREDFEQDEGAAFSASFTDEDGPTVRLTAPYDALDLFEDDEDELLADAFVAPPAPVQTSTRVGRNEPCPCGSGKKYKRCHLPLDEAERTKASAPARVHERDEALVGEMLRYGLRRFGAALPQAWFDAVEEDVAPQLTTPWCAYHVQIEGKPLAQWFAQERSGRLSPDDRAWLAAQAQAWLSVWEVLDAQPGEGVRVKDLLSGEERAVVERRASRSLVRRDAVLARVVDHGGISVFCGMHPRSLPPSSTANVVEAAKKRLRRRRLVPVARLLDEKIGRFMIECWEYEAIEHDAASLVPPQLANTDGDPLVMTTDHFAIDPARHADIATRIQTMDGAVQSNEAGEPTEYAFQKAGNAMHRNWDNTIIGHVRLRGDQLLVETNSIERANALRERIERALGGLVRHRARDVADPLSEPARRAARERNAGRSDPTQAPEVLETLREVKRQHYEAWLDEPIPALEGKTPRDAVRTKRGRAEVDTLLKELENHEARLPGPERIDLGPVRAALGLEA